MGALSTDLLGVVTRTTGYVRDNGLADGLACCFRAVDGSIQVLVPPFVPGHERYPTAKPEDSIAYLCAELLPGAEVAFQVVDDGACVTFSVTVLDGGGGGTGNAGKAVGLSARLSVPCGVGHHSGRGRVALMRLTEDTWDDSQVWIRVVSDERGATLRDGVSIDEATQIGHLTPGAVARFMSRALYDSPGLGDH